MNSISTRHAPIPKCLGLGTRVLIGFGFVGIGIDHINTSKASQYRWLWYCRVLGIVGIGIESLGFEIIDIGQDSIGIGCHAANQVLSLVHGTLS